MRARRLRQHGSPALQAAVETKLVSVFRAGEIARLPSDEQEIAVAQWTNRTLRRSLGQTIAADVIRRELRNSEIDLGRVISAIREGVADYA